MIILVDNKAISYINIQNNLNKKQIKAIIYKVLKSIWYFYFLDKIYMSYIKQLLKEL